MKLKVCYNLSEVMELSIRKLFALILFCLVSERKIRIYQFFENKIILSTAEKNLRCFICGELDGKLINGIGAGFPQMLRKRGGYGIFWR